MAKQYIEMDEKEQAKWKPCPFCAGKDFEINTKEFFEEKGLRALFIKCTKCWAQAWVFSVDYLDKKIETYDELMELLKKKWNTRKGGEDQ